MAPEGVSAERDVYRADEAGSGQSTTVKICKPTTRHMIEIVKALCTFTQPTYIVVLEAET